MNNAIHVTLAVLLLIGILPLHAGEEKEKEVLYWVAPMDPAYRRDGPGKSPMGMDLIPVYADAQDSGSDVTISPAVVQNLGVRTEPVTAGTLSRVIDTVGYIDFDESKVSHVHLRVSGWIERLSVKSAGERVKKGQRLFNLYAPDLVNAQKEFLRALTNGNKELIAASKERLNALGISWGEISALEKKRKVRQTIAIYASQNGIVSDLPVRDGMYVKPQMKVMTLADLSSVWLIAEVFERQVNAVSEGDKAEANLPYLPGKTWQGTVEYIYPSLDPKNRTLRARLRFDNPEESLKPNMYAQVKLFAKPKQNALSIPLEALIHTGDKDRVIVAVGEGKFDAREIIAGIESDDRIEVVEGLEAGDNVVTSGQFLLDSEASLKASFTRMRDAEEMAGDSDDSEAVMDMPMPISGRGDVISVDSENRQIELKHDPIPALEWPSMTMTFDLDDQVDIEGIGAGSSLSFDLEKRGDDYAITALQLHKKEQ